MVSPAVIDLLAIASDSSLAEQDPSHFDENKSSGSMIPIDWKFFNRYPVFSDLVTDPGVVASLQKLGFPEVG